MSLVAGLAISLALGLFAELTSSAVRRVFNRGKLLTSLIRFRDDVRLLIRDRDRVSAAEALGVGGAAMGAALAGGAAIGAVPGSGVLVYLALVLAAAGGHLAAATAPTSAGIGRGGRARLEALMAEPAFLVSLAAVFLRWRTADLEAIRGAHAVLGPGLTVGEPAVIAGVAVAAVMLAVTGALRLGPDPGDESGAGGGIAVAGTLARWLVAGATSLVAGALLAAEDARLDPAALPMLGVATAAALLLGLSRGSLSVVPGRLRPVLSLGALVPAIGAALLVAAG